MLIEATTSNAMRDAIGSKWTGAEAVAVVVLAGVVEEQGSEWKRASLIRGREQLCLFWSV